MAAVVAELMTAASLNFYVLHMEDRMHVTCPNEGVVVRRIDAERKMGVSVPGSLSIGPRRCFSVPYEVLDDPSLNHSEKGQSWRNGPLMRALLSPSRLCAGCQARTSR